MDTEGGVTSQAEVLNQHLTGQYQSEVVRNTTEINSVQETRRRSDGGAAGSNIPPQVSGEARSMWQITVSFLMLFVSAFFCSLASLGVSEMFVFFF